MVSYPAHHHPFTLSYISLTTIPTKRYCRGTATMLAFGLVLRPLTSLPLMIIFGYLTLNKNYEKNSLFIIRPVRCVVDRPAL